MLEWPKLVRWSLLRLFSRLSIHIATDCSTFIIPFFLRAKLCFFSEWKIIIKILLLRDAPHRKKLIWRIKKLDKLDIFCPKEVLCTAKNQSSYDSRHCNKTIILFLWSFGPFFVVQCFSVFGKKSNERCFL